MKKLLVACLVMAMTLPAGAALAAGKKAPKKEAAKKWECTMGDKKIMTATLDECMKMGGLVMNYPGPAPAKAAAKAPKAKKK
ncbi:hypothetical protein [Fundidesulfovibrio soli]|uniref:hypothetical protein n=1 Tax=Fundidesulfovibrio soli TaxID=2922716 RepID=UPI001FAFDEA3|nr:hypothetical protein [Fundidesulfovibrio soli]